MLHAPSTHCCTHTSTRRASNTRRSGQHWLCMQVRCACIVALCTSTAVPCAKQWSAPDLPASVWKDPLPACPSACRPAGLCACLRVGLVQHTACATTARELVALWCAVRLSSNLQFRSPVFPSEAAPAACSLQCCAMPSSDAPDRFSRMLCFPCRLMATWWPTPTAPPPTHSGPPTQTTVPAAPTSSACRCAGLGLGLGYVGAQGQAGARLGYAGAQLTCSSGVCSTARH